MGNFGALSRFVLMTGFALLGGFAHANKHDQETSGQHSSEAIAPLVRQQSESLFADYAQMRAKQVQNVDYDLLVNIDEKSTNFSGVVRLNFELSKDNSADLTIDFDSGKVSSLKVNGKPAKFIYEKWFITVPASQLQAGKNSIEIAYERPYATDGSGLHRFVDPEDAEVYLYSNFEPYDANRLFPHFDQPDLKATYTLRVSAPPHLKVISSTRESKIEEHGAQKLWSFPTSAKFSSYVFSLHAGNYVLWEDRFEDIPLRLFARQSLAKFVKTEEWFEPTKQSFGFFQKYFDVKYPFIKYDQIIAPDFNAGAMENVASVTFSERYVSRGEKSDLQRMSLANVIAHEMAHMWFGDLVTMRWWNGLWLNESFATYMANLALSKASKYENVWNIFYAGSKQAAYRLDDSVNTHPIEQPVLSTGDTNFDGITYGKGASVLKQLPFYLGEENFRIGVSSYLKKFSYQNTDLDDFVGELGKAAGKDMTQWTKEWLDKAGLNTIKANYECAENKISSFNIEQTAPEGYPTLREQRVQIGLYNLSGSVLKLSSATPVLYKGAMTQISELIGKPCPDLVYPNEADWGYVRVDLDEKSFVTVQNHINAVANVMTRSMLWQSLADSVVHGNLSAEKLVEFAITNIAGEANLDVARVIVLSLGSALAYLETATLLKQKDYSKLHEKVETLIFSLLQNAKLGSDFQKLWYDQYVGVSKSTKNLANLQDIVNGKVSFDGLSVDQDKRWGILVKLNKYQFGNYKVLLTSEKAKDKSDSGVNMAILSEVVRPERQVKEKWFNIVVNNPDKLKLSTLRYVMNGLFPAEQNALEAPYRSKILAHILKLNAGSDLALLGSFTNAMLPNQCTSQNEKELAKLVEEYKDMKPQVVKSVKATHENVSRCVRALKLL